MGFAVHSRMSPRGMRICGVFGLVQACSQNDFQGAQPDNPRQAEVTDTPRVSAAS